MLKFNDKESSKERGRTKPLSLKNEYKAIEILNKKLEAGFQTKTSKADIALLQRFINHYQNMSHYVAYTGGLWCTDKPEKVIDNDKLLFQLSFK